jgi:hypothetical protein
MLAMTRFGRRQPGLARVVWPVLTVAATAALMFVLRMVEPLFWYQGDRRNQYLPVFMDIGRRLRSGEFPTIDPDLGISGNYALDLQYGLYEPTHWLVAVGLSPFDDLGWATFLWSTLYLLVFALGTCLLVQRLTDHGAWAAAAGVAAATSGFVFYNSATTWVPGLMAAAWLPWLWWAWAGEMRPRRVLAVGVFSFLTIAGGWPAAWLMVAALGLGFAVEAVARRAPGEGARSWLLPLGVRALAGVGGAVAAAVTVLPLAQSSAYVARKGSISNDNFLVPNFADIFAFAAPSLHGDLKSFGDASSISDPIYFAAWFGLPVLWLVAWRTSLARRPGLVTGAVATVAMLMLTQVPSAFGPLRDPIRQLAGVQIYFTVTVAVLAATGLVVNRHRVVGIAASLLAVGCLAWARHPEGYDAILGMAAVAVATAVLVAVIARRRMLVSGVVALVATLGLTGVSFGLYDYPTFYADGPHTTAPGALTFGADDWPMFAVYEKGENKQDRDIWWDDGVGRGFERLSATTRMAPGYSSVQQRRFIKQFCIPVSHGYTCDTVVNRLFQTEPETGKPWIDLLGYKTMVIASDAGLQQFENHAGPEWHEVASGKQFVEFQRDSAAVSGRVTAVVGDADVQAVDVSRATQTYDVSTDDGATLVFRDLYWPHYTATLDGRSLKVSPLHGMLVSVRLPAGADGELTVTYHPMTTVELAGIPVAGAALVALAMVLAALARRSAGRRAPSPEPEPEAEPEPAAEPEPDGDSSAGVDGDGDQHRPDQPE